jgi:hypothetical protein
MKTFKIENAKSKFFTSKEHYLAFRQAWKDYYNATDGGGLTKEHHFILKALSGGDIGAQFTPIGAAKIPSKGPHAYYALTTALWTIDWIVKSDIKYDRESYKQKFGQPFGDTITLDMLAAMVKEIPAIALWKTAE